MTSRLIVGDVFDVLATLEPGSVDLVLTSSPFLALRSYLPADHPDKHKEIGSEATPADFIDTLLDVVEACDRVLAPHGSICFELGDTYAGSGGAGGDYDPDGLREGQPAFVGSKKRSDGGRYVGGYSGGSKGHDVAGSNGAFDERPGRGSSGWPLAKSLCGIPGLFQNSLAYGRNLLRPERTTPPWRVRNQVAWCRPNPPVGALGDKVRPATSYLTIACKSAKRWFDLDAVRTEQTEPDRVLRKIKDPERDDGWGRATPGYTQNGAGAPPLDYWVIPTHPYRGAHYATWPPELCRTPILTMCPRKVCRTCGEPSRRIVGDAEYTQANGEPVPLGGWRSSEHHRADGGWKATSRREGMVTGVRSQETLGWSDCGHNNTRPGLVLDPFAGSGTTLLVAEGNGRDAIGIDLDPRNADLARQRCGMFLNIAHHLSEGAH